MSKFVVGATRDDVPHLTPEQKAELRGSIPPCQRDARARGIPQPPGPSAAREARPRRWRRAFGTRRDVSAQRWKRAAQSPLLRAREARSALMTDDPLNMPDRLAVLESAVARLRQQLEQVSAELGSNPANTRLVIQRVNVMKQIMVAQTEIDRLRGQP
ncbi:hypothetical protein [Reyranella sp.]|uniref:hypothetical protein n=1 Tax=Reyranella sp. TaxID=1929291 RepID=UPI003D0C8096